jgi:virginiamycin A acetyltransferase
MFVARPIGDGAVVGAHSVVTHDVAHYAVVAGNPARRIRRRYDDADVDSLLDSRWWDWRIETITSHAATLMSGTPQEVARIAATIRHGR